MRRVSFELVFVYGKGLDDLIDLLESNPRFVFEIEKRRKGRNGWAVWRHKQPAHAGHVKLVGENGVFRGIVTDRADGRLTGSFLSWIIRNADDLVHRIDFWIE